MAAHGPYDHLQPPSDYNPDRKLFGRGQAAGEWDDLLTPPPSREPKLPFLSFIIALCAAFAIGISGGYYLGVNDNPGARTRTGAEPIYVRMDPINLPLPDGNGNLTGGAMLTVVIEVPDTAAADRVRNLSPRLRDKMMTELGTHTRGGDPVSTSSEGLKEAREQITALARQVIGAKYITQVLIVNVLNCPPSLGQQNTSRRSSPNW
ncbi:flagellar FliL protein [uncultured Gammaproteobacteria bacterium]